MSLLTKIPIEAGHVFLLGCALSAMAAMAGDGRSAPRGGKRKE